jgi:hypothetical protein
VVTALLLWVVRRSPAVGLDVDQVDRDPAVGEQDRGGGAREAAADRLQLLDGQLLADTWGFEVRPNEFDVAFQPLHQVAIPHIGLFLGEMWDLDALAADCADDGVWDFLLTAAPLPVTGAVGSPVNPIAVK